MSLSVRVVGVTAVMALWGHTVADPWILSTDVFTADHYQSSAYVANGYFGQRLPVEGAGYWIYRDSSTGGYAQNCTPPDSVSPV
jgi:hypothetical protein